MESNKTFPIFGLISIILGVCGSLPFAVLMVLLFLIEFYSLRAVDAFLNDAKNEVLLGLIALGMLTALSIGIILGLIGVFREKGNKVFAVFGVSFNALFLLSLTALIIIGIYAES